MNAIIMPIWQDGKTVFVQTRSIDGSGSKYKSYGKKPVHILKGGMTPDVILLTEDLLSSVVVSRVYSAMPLFGAAVPLETLQSLSKRFKRIGIWLDMDKTKESRRALSRALQLGLPVFTIHTEKDPKYYSADEIKEIVNERLVS